jgi:hypothetical protein
MREWIDRGVESVEQRIAGFSIQQYHDTVTLQLSAATIEPLRCSCTAATINQRITTTFPVT